MIVSGDKPLPMRIYVFTHTHWDREWYLSQRQFQVLLGDTMDEVLDTCEADPSFPPFTADGQTCLVEDYLEIRPEQRRRMLRLIDEGRILIGPWYTMPDIWLPDGESLIRNLQAGHLDCLEYGVEQPLIGYVPDSFGHIEQMPQILQGFGIGNYLFGRGKPCDADLAGLEFIWVGPDGQSEVTAHVLPEGYMNAMMLPAVTEHRVLQDTIERALKPYMERSAAPQIALLCNGVDHIWLQQDLPEILESARRLFPDYEIRAGGIQDYLTDFASRPVELKRHSGILQSRKLSSDLLHGTWSSRVDHKLANARSLMVLESWAEPLTALASVLLGAKARRSEINLAWRLLFQNHAHDSICGCSADSVGLDVDRRYAQSQEISESIAADALGHWSEAFSSAGGARLLVVAGLGGRTGCVEVRIDSSTEACPTIRDENGSALPMQNLARRKISRQDVVLNRDEPEASNYLEMGMRSFEFWEHRVLIQPPASPACSLHAYEISSQDTAPAPISAPVTVGESFLENDLVRADVIANGTLRVLHKATGVIYSGLLELRDEADIGGGYVFTPIANEPARSSTECVAKISMTEQGPLRGGLRIEVNWSLPVEAGLDRLSRSTATAICDWITEVTLEAGSETLRFHSKLTNRAKEHRIRLLFPLPFATNQAHVERSFVVTQDSPDRYEADPGQNSHAMRNWVALEDPVGGMAFIGKGLHEWTLNDNRLEVTVLRSVPFVRTCGSWLTPDGLMLKEVSFDYALAFYGGTWRDGQVPARAAEIVHESFAQAFGQAKPTWSPLPHASVVFDEVTPAGNVEVSSHRSNWQRHFSVRDGWRRDRALVLKKSPETITTSCVPVRWSNPHVLLSAFKRADDTKAGSDLILRFYSLAAQDAEVVFTFGLPVVQACLTDLREIPSESLTIMENSTRLTMRPFQIVTLRLQVGEPV